MHPHEALNLVLLALERLGLAYSIGGSLASGYWGESRPTADSDVLVDLPRGRVRELVRALEKDFYIDESSVLGAIVGKKAFNVIHFATARKVDLFVSGDSWLDREEFERRRLEDLDPFFGRPVALAAPEIIVLRKLDWFRRSDDSSQRQWRDVLGVLKAGGRNLDMPFLVEAAGRLGLLELFERARGEAGIGPSIP